MVGVGVRVRGRFPRVTFLACMYERALQSVLITWLGLGLGIGLGLGVRVRVGDRVRVGG